MSKPTWRPEVPPNLREQDIHLCHCCGWRSADRGEAFCERCRTVAREAPPQSPRPTPIRVRSLDTPAQRRRGHTPEEKAWIDHVLTTDPCPVCGSLGHTSTDCPSVPA